MNSSIDDSKKVDNLKLSQIKIPKNVFILGVTGCSRSGKTTLCQTILNTYQQEKVIVFHQDDYYMDDNYVIEQLNGNWESEHAFHWNTMKQDVIKAIHTIKSNQPSPKLDYTSQSSQDTQLLLPSNSQPLIQQDQKSLCQSDQSSLFQQDQSTLFELDQSELLQSENEEYQEDLNNKEQLKGNEDKERYLIIIEGFTIFNESEFYEIIQGVVFLNLSDELIIERRKTFYPECGLDYVVNYVIRYFKQYKEQTLNQLKILNKPYIFLQGDILQNSIYTQVLNWRHTLS